MQSEDTKRTSLARMALALVVGWIFGIAVTIGSFVTFGLNLPWPAGYLAVWAVVVLIGGPLVTLLNSDNSPLGPIAFFTYTLFVGVGVALGVVTLAILGSR